MMMAYNTAPTITMIAKVPYCCSKLTRVLYVWPPWVSRPARRRDPDQHSQVTVRRYPCQEGDAVLGYSARHGPLPGRRADASNLSDTAPTAGSTRAGTCGFPPLEPGAPVLAGVVITGPRGAWTESLCGQSELSGQDDRPACEVQGGQAPRRRDRQGELQAERGPQAWIARAWRELQLVLFDRDHHAQGEGNPSITDRHPLRGDRQGGACELGCDSLEVALEVIFVEASLDVDRDRVWSGS